MAARLREYRSHDLAVQFMRKLKLKNEKEWKAYCKSGELPLDITANLQKIYENKGWRGLGHWLGTGNVSNRDKEFPVFEEARELARMSKIRTKEEWGEFSNSSLLHSSIPKAPQHVYKNSGWLGWKDWLGTGQKG